MRSTTLVLVLMMLCILPAFARPGGAGVTYLLVEHPERLIVYNSYQQQASPAERRSFQPFVPMMIVRTRALLGDGYTSCMEVQIAGTTFFLLREQENLAGGAALGLTRQLDRATVMNDTVEVIGQQLELRPVSGDRRVSLKRGDRLTRCFEREGRVYAGVLGDRPSYGWIEPGAAGLSRALRVIQDLPAAAATGIPVRVTEGAASILLRANRVLRATYRQLNRETGSSRLAPHWNMTSSGSSLQCMLEGTAEPRSYERSTQRMARDLETLILGMGLELSVSPGKIEVRRP